MAIADGLQCDHHCAIAAVRAMGIGRWRCRSAGITPIARVVALTNTKE